MLRMKQIAIMLLVLLFGSPAVAACALQNQLQNGTPADAMQVMANFTALLNCINAPPPNTVLPGYLGGLTLANDASPTSIDIAPGVATSDDMTTSIAVPALVIKNLSTVWGVGNGCLDPASSLTPSTWYHIFVIERTDTGVVDEFCSTFVSPTLPTSFNKKRRIGSIRTNGSGQILSFVQKGDLFLWSTSVSGAWDFANVAVSSTGTVFNANSPTGVICEAIIDVATVQSTGFYNIRSSFQAGITSAVFWNFGLSAPPNGVPGGQYRVLTGTNSEVVVVGNANYASGFFMSTVGWVDRRGRDD